VEHIAGAVAHRQPESAAGAAVMAVLREEGVEVLCGRETVELRRDVLRAAPVASQWT
jgi:hypothetical protein